MSAILAVAGPALDAAAQEWITSAVVYSRFSGPDGDEIQILEECGIGHCHLAVDSATAAPPLTLDGKVWLSADVRLDDRAGLVATLRSERQPAPAIATDGELLLRAYLCWGERFLERIAGDFAFALWDARARRLLCARDQIGVVPLHYAVAGETLLVSSALDALLLHPRVSDRFDEDALADFVLAGRASDFGATAYADIRRLPPAHVLSWSRGRVALRRYWHQPVSGPLMRFDRPAEYVSHFRQLLEHAVADRLPAGPTAVHLSGGMDSTTLAALAQRGPGAASLRAVTGELGGASGDEEGAYARLVAEGLGLPIDVVDDSGLTPTDPHAPPEVRAPEPSPYRWTCLELEMARRALDHAGVCLSGLGADPLLAFTPRYSIDWLLAGHPLRVIAALADQPRLFGDRPRPHVRSVVRDLVGARRVASRPPPAWLATDFVVRTAAAERSREAQRAWVRTRGWRSLTEDPCWHTWLTWGHPAFSGVPLRTRHPFMDIRLVDFATRIAPYPWFVDKRILREATADLLPEIVRRRPKTPLVDAPRRGTEQATVQRLVEFIREVPQAEQFIDRESLTRGLLTPSGVADAARNSSLRTGLGLVHWLAHRTVPVAWEAVGSDPFGRGRGART